ncbi:MAG: putative alpha-1,2-mannosidase [Saprospiraceae bacterium]|jgi:predicted alpha-1,2-mannosidase
MYYRLKPVTVFVFCFIIIGLQFSCTADKISNATDTDIRPVDQVYPLLDAANSRWFYFASACRPFGMVNLSPDTQLGGAWGSGYRYDTDTIKGFSHIHAWQMSGVSVMPVAYKNRPEKLLTNYESQFNHSEEKVEVGYHSLLLNRYGIEAELSSTKRVGFHRYSFPGDQESAVVFNMSGQLGPCEIKDGSLRQIDKYTLQGQMTNMPTRRRPKDLIVYFYVKFDTPISNLLEADDRNVMIQFGENKDQIHMKVSLSYTSIENAQLNMTKELNHWDFEKVVSDSKDEWNDLLSRVVVEDNDSIQERRFYTDLWHSLQGRRIISDVNGAYPDNTGGEFRIGKVPLNSTGEPKFNHYNSDSFWGAQWTITTLWGLLYPKVYNEFVNSLLLYYKDGGLIPRGPSGGNYTYVMTGASATPFIVSAFQKGIKDYDTQQIYAGLKKNHMSMGIMSKAGYEHNTTIGGGLDYYIKNGYVPHPIPEGKFGFHQDGASLTMEYAYQDWTLAQMAKALGHKEDYSYFLNRSSNYTNSFDKGTGWMRAKDVDGNWKEDFDPFEYEAGFNESNGAQSTWFVPHDIEGLADLMGGKEAAAEKLNAQFEEAALKGFTSGTSHERGEDPNRARIPINYGNQPSMQTASIFNHLGRPDLTQFWIGQVRSKAFGGLSPHSGYNGDEDQGLMGALAVLLKLGIFQMTGGTEANPVYELTTPLFQKTILKLENGMKVTIKKNGTGTYINSVTWNDKRIGVMDLRHDQIMKGGVLEILCKE